jgi:UDP-N-acetylmuramate dehydrogenase
MNAGCYGSETKDVLVEAYALTRGGERITLSLDDMKYSYRRSARVAAEPLIFVGAPVRGAARRACRHRGADGRDHRAA